MPLQLLLDFAFIPLQKGKKMTLAVCLQAVSLDKAEARQWHAIRRKDGLMLSTQSSGVVSGSHAHQ